jgi:hypothetical protein
MVKYILKIHNKYYLSIKPALFVVRWPVLSDRQNQPNARLYCIGQPYP